MVENLPAMQEIQVQSLGREDPLEKGMAMHSSILAWKIPWTEEPGGLHSTGLQREKCKSKLQWGITSNQSEWVSEWKSLSCVWLFVTPWVIQSMEFFTPVIGSLSLLQRIFPTQGSNPGLPHCRRILHQLSHKRSPRISEWVAYPFPRWSSQPRNRTRVSWIAGRFFTNWAIRGAPSQNGHHQKILQTINAGGNVEKRESPYLLVWM